jgi:hypothetical protein
MSTSIVCPDCGGIVGAKKMTAEGPPCTCFHDPPPPPPPSEEDVSDPSDPSATHFLDSPAKPRKICCKCGKDVTKKKRLRDSLGYWCVTCHRMDQKKHEPQGVPCPSCGRLVKAETRVHEEGQKICSRCLRERKEARKPGNKRFRAISVHAFERHEKQRLVILLAIFAILSIIILLNWMGVIGTGERLFDNLGN